MFKIFIIIVLFVSKLPGEWHSRHNPPKPGQLYMTVTSRRNGYFVTPRIIITHYNPDFERALPVEGWYDVTRKDVWKWMRKGYVIYVFPRKYRTYTQEPYEWDG